MDNRVSMSDGVDGAPPVNVSFDLAVNSLIQFDQQAGRATWSVYYRLYWNDDRLSYNGTREFGTSWSSRDCVRVQSSAVWTPDAVPFRGGSVGLEGEEPLCVYDDDFLRANGYNAFWTRDGEVHVPCEMNFQGFPFDSQQCTFVVGPWLDRSYYFRSKHEGNVSRPFAGAFHSEEWEVRGAWMESTAEDHVNGQFQEVHYNMVLRRYPHFLLVNAVLPMAVVVTLSTMTLWLPIEGGSGERLGFSVTLLLTIMATALFTAEFRPATREDTWLDRYQAICICLTFFPVFESVVVVWLQHILERVSDLEEEDRLLTQLPSGSTADGGRLPEKAEDSSRLIKSARRARKATFRMRMIVLWLQKIPSLEYLVTGKRSSAGFNPRSIDMGCRYFACCLNLATAVVVVGEIPDDAVGSVSVVLLAPPICAGVLLYLLTLLLGFVLLVCRIAVLCNRQHERRRRLAGCREQQEGQVSMLSGAPADERSAPHNEESPVVLPFSGPVDECSRFDLQAREKPPDDVAQAVLSTRGGA